MMNIDIIIDSREEKLIGALESSHLKKECEHLLFDIATLDVGDIIYKHDKQVLCIIERKTIDDYANSIIDKRSKNQSIRISQLRKEFPNILVIYLIEGNGISKDYKFRNGITRDALYSSLINRVIKDRFTIYRSNDIYDTALIVTKLYDKLLINLRECQKGTTSDERIEYLKTIKLSKKDNMTPINCYLCQLSQIPGVSIEIAKIISEQYASMHQLISAYEQQSNQKDREQLLSELMIPMANDKMRRLGFIISKRIYHFLYNLDEEPHVQQEQDNQVSKKLVIKLKNKEIFEK